MKTEESRVLHIECSVLNLLEKMRAINWVIDSADMTVLDFMNLQDYYPVTTYEQKIMRLLGKIHLKVIYSKKEYSNGSIYIG